MYTEVLKIISKYDLNTEEIGAYCQTICIADMLKGTNQKELTLSKLYRASQDSEWGRVLKSIGLPCKVEDGKSDLPEVQKYRVILDALIICIHKTGKLDSKYTFCSEATKSIYSGIGGSDYKNIDECKNLLFDLVGGTESSRLAELEDTVKNLNLIPYIRDKWSTLDTSYKSEMGLFRYNPKSNYDTDTIADAAEDYLITSLYESIINRVYSLCTRGHEVALNITLNRYISKHSHIVFGLNANTSLTHPFIVRQDLPSFARVKCEQLFSGGMIMDITNLSELLELNKLLEGVK